MNTCDPIRDKGDVELFKEELKRNGSRDYMLAVLGMNTELMMNDIVNLRVRDARGKTVIKVKAAIARQEKDPDKAAKKINLTEGLCEELERYTRNMSKDDFLFPSRKGGGPLNRSSVYSIVRKAAKACHLENIGTISLKKTFAYHHYQEYHDLPYLQKLFHHDGLSETMRFIGMSEEEILNFYSKKRLLL